MNLKGYFDKAGPMELSGWACDEDQLHRPVTVDLHINEQKAASLSAAIFRPDLRDARIGTGQHGFCFNPCDLLRQGSNRIDLYYSGTDQLVAPGRVTVQSLTNPDELARRAQHRWRAAEPDTSLTWGILLTGDSFIEVVQRFHKFRAGTRIVELGPGYGRLLRSIQHFSLPFEHYLALDVSDLRTRKLRRNFEQKTRRLQFETGNCATYEFQQTFDIAISAILFERLFPSMRETLLNLARCLNPGGMAFIDFIAVEPEMLTSRAYFEDDIYRAYLRIYSRQEIHRFFQEAGFRIVELIYPVSPGFDPQGQTLKRSLVVAEKIA